MNLVAAVDIQKYGKLVLAPPSLFSPALISFRRKQHSTDFYRKYEHDRMSIVYRANDALVPLKKPRLRTIIRHLLFVYD